MGQPKVVTNGYDRLPFCLNVAIQRGDREMTDQGAHAIDTNTVSLAVSDGTTLPAYAARPQGGGSGRGLMVFQEAFGVNAHIRDVTERFARLGYTAMAPALFHRTDAS